jgi:membrane-associated phospholipid phosphatase
MRRIASCLALVVILGATRTGLAQPKPAGEGGAAGETGAEPAPSLPSPKLTPVPAPPERPLPAYQLYWEVDVPLLTIAAVFGIGRNIRGGLAPAYCAPQPGSPTEQTAYCDPQNLNWLDRQVAGRYHPRWGLWSDVGVYGLEALGAAAIIADEGLRSGVNDIVVVAEATLAASAASGVSTAITGRPRPYMYGIQAPLEVRQDGNGGLSFFSGHTSTAFGAVTATFMTLHRLHPRARWPWFVLSGGVAAAGFVGATRILAGWHFPTDVIAGAAVGTSIGLLVPALRAAPRRVTAVPMALASGGGIALAGPLP